MPHVVAAVSESIRRGQFSPAARSFFSSRVRVRIPIGSEADIALAEQHGRQLATRLAFSPADITVIATAIVEVAGNILRYAQRGDLMLRQINRSDRIGIAIVARDKGPGIADVEQAICDGKGMGLATTRRLMDEFRIRSEPGRGTSVTMRKWTHRRQVERAGRRDAR